MTEHVREVRGESETVLHECNSDNEAELWIQAYMKDGFGGWDHLTLWGMDHEEPYLIETITPED